MNRRQKRSVSSCTIVANVKRVQPAEPAMFVEEFGHVVGDPIGGMGDRIDGIDVIDIIDD
jgi:hypothetical protein